jgi:hypothetical protein
MAGVTALSGCSRAPLDVPAPTPSGSTADICLTLANQLPSSVLGFGRRDTVGNSAYTAAWGQDTVIVLRCGVTRPAALTPSAQVLEVNGVDWLPETFERGTVFTTAGRSAYVEVQVPLSLRPEARVLVDLAEAITQAVPPGDPDD